MIRFSAFLVVAAVGTLVAGVVTSKLLLVYIAIGVSGLALLALGAGAAVHWRELTGKPETAAARATSRPPAVVPPQVTTPEPAATPVASAAAGAAASRPAWPGTVPVGSSRPGYPPPATRPPAPSEWKWRDDPAPTEAASREAAAEKPAASLASQRDSTVAGDRPSAPDEDLSVQDQTMIFRQPDQTMIFRAQPLAASTAEPEPSPAAATAAAEDTAPPPGDGDAEPAPAGDTAAEDSTSSEAGAGPADDAAPPDDAVPPDDAAPSDDAAPPDKAAPEDEPEPADDATTVTKAAGPADPASDLEVTVVPGVPRYHKATCILIRFMGDSDLDKMTVAAAKDAGCTPCRACLPDQSEGSPE